MHIEGEESVYVEGAPRAISDKLDAGGLRLMSEDDDRWKKLEVWKLDDDLALKIFEATKSFPKEELFGLTSQMRRSALSIPTNIVEGHARRGDKELAHFISISLGSLAETKYLIHFASRLGYLKENKVNEFLTGYDLLGKMLYKFFKAVRLSVKRS